MATNYISRKLKTETARRFKESFSDTGVLSKVGYIYLGKSTPYANDNVASQIFDTVDTEKKIWDQMIAAKRVVPGDVEFVIPLQRWTANTRYMQYDDQCPLDILVNGGTEGNTAILPMYVINSENNVYKCICNNVNALSLVEPTGDYTINDGIIVTETGGNTCYTWKFMYNIRESNKFLTTDWMPVPYPLSNVSTSNYNLSANNLIDGGLSKIIVTNSGSGYFHSTLNVTPFFSNSSTRLLDVVGETINTSNVKVNMEVSGSGILVGTYIVDVYTGNNRILLSNPTIGNGSSINVSTRVVIEGDGSGTLTSVRLLGNTVSKIDVITTGTEYSRANVIIYGSGTGANARAVLPPKFGHGYNPAIELGANNIMIVERIGEVDATENGLIPTDTSFRQYGLLLNPYKYESDVSLTNSTANSVVELTTDLTLLAGSAYTLGEYVYQGTVANSTFSGFVVSQTNDVVKLTDAKGTVANGVTLFGQSSATARPVAGVKFPDLKPYAGDIVYSENILKVDRSPGQAEEIKLVFKF